MGFFRVSFLKDLRRIRRDPAAVLLSVGMPVLIGLLLRLIAGGGGSGQPTATLLVADKDDSFLSGLLVGALGQGPLTDLVVTEAVGEDEGRRRMDEGEASGFLIIPEEFGARVLDREATTLTLVTNPSQRILPGILKEALGFVADALSSVQNILGYSVGPSLDQVLDLQGPPSDALVSEVGVSVNQLMARVQPYLLPPVIEVETTFLEEPARPQRSFGEIFFPSMFFLAIIFAANSLSDDVWKEKVQGTLRRTVTTPGHLAVFLLAKLGAATLVLALVSTVALVLARWAFGFPGQNIPLAVIWATGSGLFMLLLFTFIQLLASTQRGGNLLVAGLTFPLIMAGGAFFPFAVMPAWMVRFGRLTPNGWALERFQEILDGIPDAGTLLATAAGLAAVGGAFYLASLMRLRRFARS